MTKHRVDLTRTFNSSSHNKRIVSLLLEIFGGNPYCSMARLVAGEVTYQPVQQPLTEELIQEHLEGTTVLGAYHLLKGSSKVKWMGWDVDSADRTIAKQYAEKIIKHLGDIPHVVEFSGQKGYHILIFFTEPVPAAQAKQIGDFVRDAEGLPKTGKNHVEVYPKQAKLSKNSPMGSLLKLPLGVHPRSHNRSMFCDTENGWEAAPALDPVSLLEQRVPLEEVLKLIKDNSTDIRQQLLDLLVPQWLASTGEHHNFALYLAGYLAHLGWGMEDAADLVLEIATQAGDSETQNRVAAVRDTFKNIEQGRNVKGFSGLDELLPGAALRTLADLASRVIAPTMVKRVDAIRLAKGPAWGKVRASARMIWADLQENGNVVQTRNNETYWFSNRDHLLTSFDSMRWEAILHSAYGINPTEAFGRQTTMELRLRAIKDADIVTVHNRAVWQDEELRINLGGSEVYVLSGGDIITKHNGQDGYLFYTDQFLSDAVIPDFENPVDVWSILTQDVNFRKSEISPAGPLEQAELLKAWILAFFFQELMPTKPLLLAMGAPGSGKTTALRRILRVLESPEAEVLEVVQDKPDSLRASLAKHKLLVLDNLEKSGAKWLVDTLNRLSTGANIELRKLYETNATYTLKPKCFVAMTAVSMPFSDEALFSRLLPLELAVITTPKPEYLMQKELRDNIAGIWADFLVKLNQIVVTLKLDKTQTPPISSRLADFTVFCKRIEKSGVVNGELLMEGLRSLVDRQRMALVANSPFITMLEEWTNTQPQEAAEWHTFSELLSILEPVARAKKMPWRWSTSNALAQHVLVMREPLQKLYGAEFAQEEEIYKVRFNYAIVQGV